MKTKFMLPIFSPVEGKKLIANGSRAKRGPVGL